METNKIYNRAKCRVGANNGLRNHIIIYMVVITVLIIINLNSSSNYFWAKWPMMGWGIALLFHFLNIFVFPSKKHSVTEEMIQKEMRKTLKK